MKRVAVFCGSSLGGDISYAQAAVALETKPAEQTTLVNPFVSIPLAWFVVQAVVLFQASFPFVQVRLTARPREALASNPTAMTAATSTGVDF